MTASRMNKLLEGCTKITESIRKYLVSNPEDENAKGWEAAADSLDRLLKNATPVWSDSRTYYECGICDYHHAIEWDGDCREDAARLNVDELDAKHGAYWTEAPMPGGEKE